MGHYTEGMYVCCTTLTKYLHLWIFYDAWCLERIMIWCSASCTREMIMVLSTGQKMFNLTRIKKGWPRGFKWCMQEGTWRKWKVATETVAGHCIWLKHKPWNVPSFTTIGVPIFHLHRLYFWHFLINVIPHIECHNKNAKGKHQITDVSHKNKQDQVPIHGNSPKQGNLDRGDVHGSGLVDVS